MQIPANPQDWFNYLARQGISNHLIQIVVRLEGQLDQTRLEQAFKLALASEPILGCSFEETDPPHWQSLPEPARLELCRLHVCQEPEQALHEYLCQPITNRAQVEGRLLRAPTQEILCVKLDHASCDGGAAKHFIKLLVQAYNRPASIRANPTPADRSLQPLWQSLAITSPAEFWQADKAALAASWSFPHALTTTPGQAAFAMRQLNPKTLHGLVSLAHRNAASLTDVLLSAYYRTLKTIEPQAAELNLTVDLRRHLKTPRPISNLSAIIEIRPVAGESFEDAVKHNARLKRDLLAAQADIHSALACHLLENLGFAEAARLNAAEWQQARQTGHCSPMLSNLGTLSIEAFEGGIAAKDACMIAPCFHAPACLLAASTYRDKLTLSVGFHEPEIGADDIKHLLDSMCAELASAASNQTGD